jgi:hypothetical protein
MATNEAGNTANGGSPEQRVNVSIDAIGLRSGDPHSHPIDAGEAFA